MLEGKKSELKQEKGARGNDYEISKQRNAAWILLTYICTILLPTLVYNYYKPIF